jgi:sec-independent protein translocase protein TatC
MASEEQREIPVSGSEVTPGAPETASGTDVSVPPAESGSDIPAEDVTTSYTQTTDDPYNYYDDPYAVDYPSTPAEVAKPAETAPVAPPPATPPPTGTEDEDEDDDGMLRMSFLEHLEELRARLLRMLMGVGVAFGASLIFAERLWLFVQTPAETALKQLGANPPHLVAIDPMDQFSIIYVKLPILTAIFLSSPWILYQVWSFVAPGLYKHERRWAGPFIVCSAGLFVIGGLFAYFVAFRFGLTFLLGIGRDVRVSPMVSMVSYFDLFTNVMLGVSLLFELPVIIFLLTLLRIVTPGFLVRNSRYAILLIVVLAAVITPTPDIFNLVMFAAPMVVLFYIGIFASYLLTLGREGREFPWRNVLIFVGIVALAVSGLLYFAVTKYGYKFIGTWPFFTR